MPPSISDPSAEPQTLPNRRHWPADYYSSATPEPVLPRWASYGCGAAAVLVLVGVFAGGLYLSGGGFAQLMDFTFGMTLGEMRAMYTPEVTPAQKQAMERAIETMRANVREGKASTASMQPTLQAIQKAIKDEKLTPAEVDAIIAATKKPAPPPIRVP
jgi:hypothetical protein